MDVTASEGLQSFGDTLPTSSIVGVRIVYAFRLSCTDMASQKWFQRRKTDNSHIFQVLPLETEIYFFFMLEILHYEVMY